MDEVLGWSDLPEELLHLFTERLSSNIDFLRIRSICKPWRSTITRKKRFTTRFQRNLPFFRQKKTLVSATTFFRLTLPSSSSPNKGWLIKHRQISESSKINLFSPLSGLLLTPSEQTLDLMKFGVSEIRQSYTVQYFKEMLMDYLADGCVRYKFFANSDRVVVLDNRCLVVFNNEIWCCKIGDESKRCSWIRIKNVEVENFLDITLHRGHLYALDLTGAIWWISLSDQLSLYKYGPSTPLDNENNYHCKDKRLVECCGELCVIHCFCKPSSAKGVENKEGTIGFRVYKMDKDLVDWVEVNSLGDKALIVAMDSCFTVVASEYYGCLENAIYFNDDEDISVFKLDDGSIVTKLFDPSSFTYQSCFQMFFPPFVSSYSPKVLDCI